MTSYFFSFLTILTVLWGGGVIWGSVVGLRKPHLIRVSLVLFLVGIFLFGMYIFDFWMQLHRPPLRTLGETRLWYAFFLPIVGLCVRYWFRLNWFLYYCVLLSLVFLWVNHLNPDSFNRALMPALHSVWFIPHVLVYLMAYALLTGTFVIAMYVFWQHVFKKKAIKALLLEIRHADTISVLGFSFLSLGLTMGALWAKSAWGHYWAWDPKETWALITWFSYLVYIHFRTFYPDKRGFAMGWLVMSFILLLLCWFGMSYMGVGNASVHNYSNG